ncbi:restriction endonuclease subunit S [Anoxybacillus flavithermus]|uniref:Restriction endonuclease subunit S n=1 Tax=Anoxybacillus flavithermus TaxID=33934 RepID=A0AAX1ZYG2_9BACL|nr:restriction endonuclease subunit S [Anoxybacillus flavithermus]MBE2907579.1 restriction endonuclease subunit S [Anoxybacillus flavithermus]MBE2924149.1 restriction endonuclease subunit S [Anoxybacillus flavithermus]MBE2926800.1 restriction endonuclease subunit S [Anoxybacillus flavithermus]MBE2935120.1 restriction endonuclease subunit S [Anoxybacillus flavithermus]MBE2937611.1 restriction endonuclease subunit S [Anoxybacillus flavithermus]
MRKVSLGSLVNIRTGKLDANASNPEGKYPFFTCSRETLKIDTYSYDCECVLVAGNGDLNVKYYNGKFDAYQRTYIIESIDKNILNVKYLYYFMQLYVSKLRQMSIGGVIKYIKLNYLTDAKIPLPNIEKQNKIVKVLEKAQELIDKRKAQIEALDQLTQSVFLEMFGDPKTNPKNWDVIPLGELFEIKTGGTPSRENKNYWQNGKIPWVKTTEIKENTILVTEEYITEEGLRNSNAVLLPKNTILIAMYGQGKTRGRTAKLGIEATTNQACAAILPCKEHNPDFIWRQLMMQYQTLRDLGRGGNQPNLNLTLIKQFKIIVPPLSQQNTFAKIIQKIEFQKDLLQKSLVELENNFNSLMQRAFKGELFND